MASRALVFLLVTGALAWSPAWHTRWSSPTPCPTNGYGPKPTYTSPPSASGTPVATTKNGTYVGVHNAAYNQDFFLGMPYAQPPVDELRFRTPRSLNTTWSGTRTADAYSPECVGYGGDDVGYDVSEDCLTVNVIRPAGVSNEALPVAVWIHGGGYYMGGSVDRRYNLSFIVENSVNNGKPIIGVSINYRLAGWGFLASQEVTNSGNTNLGLRDQRLALHWLQENIGAFGGDPGKVTIWGESAGGSSVGFHLTAYNGRDDHLFRGAIMESGNPVFYHGFNGSIYYEPLYQSLLANVSCTQATDTLECLRQVPYAALNAAFNGTLADVWAPTVDGDFIQKATSIQLAEGQFVHVPIISGANSDEGTAFSPQGVNTEQDFLNDLTISGRAPGDLPLSLAQQILAAYPNDPCNDPPANIGCTVVGAPYGAQWRRSVAYYGDAVFIANRRLTCQTWAGAGVDAYCYRFNVVVNGVPPVIGATHFQEVAFVFDNIDGLGYATNPFAGEGQSFVDLARLMSNSWASFVHDLDPNSFKSGGYSDAPAWPLYSADQAQAQLIVWENGTTHLEPDTFRAAGIALINSFNLVYGR